MYTHCVEQRIDHFFNNLLPGQDPSNEDLDTFIFPEESALNGVLESQVNLEICRIANSVLERSPSNLTPRDTTNWSVGAGGVTSKKPPTCNSALFFADDRYRKLVYVDPEDVLPTPNASPATRELRNSFVGHCSFADIVVPIEVKVDHSDSAFEFENAQTLPLVRDARRVPLDQLEGHLSLVFGRQHRTHVISLYVYRDQARMVYTDRETCIVSAPFFYSLRSDPVLHRFFWRLAHADRSHLGYDTTVALASEEDFANMLQFTTSSTDITPYVREQLYYALCVDGTKVAGAGQTSIPPLTTHQWPLQRVTRADGTYVLVGRPRHARSSLFGRCTRGYIVYDPNKREANFMKDSWRVDHGGVHPEHEVYERLRKHSVTNVPTCLGGGDVRKHSEDTLQRTYVPRDGELNPELARSEINSPLRLPRVHYRLFIKEVLRPLTDFETWRSLLWIFDDGMCAHRDAWNKAAILHRDLSVNNIMILEYDSVHQGLLCDWDLCKYKELMEIGNWMPDRVGTWPFRSALSQQFPLKPYRLSDDIESFVHILYYLLLRFYETEDQSDLSAWVTSLFEAEDIVVDLSGRRFHIGGARKRMLMVSGAAPLTLWDNSPLVGLLSKIGALCREHYASIDFIQMRTLYGPRVALPTSKPDAKPKTFTYGPARRAVPATAIAPSASRCSPCDLVPTQTPSMITIGTSVSVQTTSSTLASPFTALSTPSRESSAPSPAPTPLRPLDTHELLINLFRKYHQDDSLWTDEYMKKGEKDLFKEAQIVSLKDNALSRSQDPRYINASLEAAHLMKKRKGNNMQGIDKVHGEELGRGACQ